LEVLKRTVSFTRLPVISEAVNFTAQLCIKNISADGIGLNARTKYRNGFHQFYLYVGSQ
jgi:hypothetical protein